MTVYMVSEMTDASEAQQTITQLYEKYNQLMYIVTYRILQHPQDAEDAVLGAWEKIIHHLDKIQAIDTPETKNFILIITERVALDMYRKNKRRSQNHVLWEELENSPFVVTIEAGYTSVEVVELLNSLPKRYSEPLLLYYINDCNIKEIASLLSISIAAARKRLDRGKKMLRKELVKDGK